MTKEGRKMRILYWKWNSFLKESIEKGFEKLSVDYVEYFYQLEDWEEDFKFQNSFLDKLKYEKENGGIDGVFSINFNPLIAKVCKDEDIPYISWIYDSPIHIRNLETLKYKTNLIFDFDRGQVEAFKKNKINCYHMSLGCDVEHFSKVIKKSSENKRKQFTNEVSFVGKLYKNDYAQIITALGEYNKGYLEGIIKSQMSVYGGYLLDSLVSNNLIANMNQDFKKNLNKKFKVNKRQIEFLVGQEIARRERFMALSLLGNRHRVTLYSGDKDENIKNVEQKGAIDYSTELPLVFNGSDINLNISLRTIQTGIPLRVWEIIGSNGFIITNFQEELGECFDLSRDIVTYSCLEELVELTDYYLKHETERELIKNNAFEHIKKAGKIEDRLRAMFDYIK